MAATIANNRQERLRAWRQQTGRTPMKRMSYVAECASQPHPSSLTPSTRRTEQWRTPLTKYRPELSVKRGTAVARRENGGLCRQREGGKRRSGVSSGLSQRNGQTKMDVQMRRKMLEEWKERNGRMLKRPPLFLKQIKQKPSRPPKRRHTIGGVGLGTAESERELLKEQFQLAITEECALETAELDTPRGKRADNKKTEKSNQDSGDGLKTRKVRFMLSEPRKRRSCYDTPGAPRTVYLTPVRRSTREGRNGDGPGMKLDTTLCFDSPSEVSKQLTFDSLQIIANDTLQ